MGEYRHAGHAVTDLKYHMVWITKYRYQVLRGDVAERARELIWSELEPALVAPGEEPGDLGVCRAGVRVANPGREELDPSAPLAAPPQISPSKREFGMVRDRNGRRGAAESLLHDDVTATLSND